MVAVQISNLSKTFRRKGAGAIKTQRALNDVSLDIASAEMVALIGASGSGKSTLLRHISGLLTADHSSMSNMGVVRVHGQDVQKSGRLCKSVRSVRSGVSVIFQQFNLVGRLTLLDNVLLGNLGRIGFWRGTLGQFSRAEKLTAMEALDRVGMAEYAMQRASTLSGGQQQRGAIARALVQRADIILADEPIASLDPESARLVMDALSAINREDATTVVVSLHQVAYAKKYCSRAVALRNGTVVFDGSNTDLDNETLCDLYGSQCQELLMDETIGAAGFVNQPDAHQKAPELRVVNAMPS
jgi:phosphonate transport system ATP-binding protein